MVLLYYHILILYGFDYSHITSCSIDGFFAPGEEITVDCEFEEYQQPLSEIDVYIWAGECEFGNCENTRAWEFGNEGTIYLKGNYRCGDSICDSTENSANCCEDCGSSCGDDYCNCGEDPGYCGQDCPGPEEPLETSPPENDSMTCSGVVSPYSCTKTFTLINNEEDFFNKAVAITVVAYDGMGYSSWFDMYDASDPVHFPEENCNDGLDNDGDGFKDCGDSECYKSTLPYKSSICGKDPTVNRTQRDHPYPSGSGTFPTYCSQGQEVSDPLLYGRCCEPGYGWDPDSQSCQPHASCDCENVVPFSPEWWEKDNCSDSVANDCCIVKDGDGKIYQTCHPTDFFGDEYYYEYDIKII